MKHSSVIMGLIVLFCTFPFKGKAQNWLPVGTGFTWAAAVNDMYVDSTADLLYIAGCINWADTLNSSPGIFAWNGTDYLPVGCGIDWDCVPPYLGAGPSVVCVTKYNNEIYVGGSFSSASGVPCNNIARWNGSTWDSVGTGINGVVAGMREINGELYVVGGFSIAGGIPVNSIAKWNGTGWSDVHNMPNYGSGNSFNDVIEYNNELYVCGNFQGANGCREIVRWNGTAWTDVGGGFYGGNSGVENMCVYQGKLYVSGYFIKSENINNPGNFIAAWDGTAWSDPAGGTFNPYQPFDNGQIHDMTVFHNELWIAGAFRHAGGVPGCDVAKWDGVKWCTFDTAGTFDARPFALAVFRDSLYLGGNFWTIGQDSILHIAKFNAGNWVDTCGQFYIGIDEPANTTSVTVYPNPASSAVTFQFADAQQRNISIYNSLGSLVHEQSVAASIAEIRTESFAEGIYFYQVTDKHNSTGSGTFVIEH